jgi:hypothetical protein
MTVTATFTFHKEELIGHHSNIQEFTKIKRSDTESYGSSTPLPIHVYNIGKEKLTS